MHILVTNDDGYNYKGLLELVEIMRPFGELTIISPKYHQSGMSMAVTMGFKPIAVKKFRDEAKEHWWYVDATPASCVKWGIDEVFIDRAPDLVVSGINHGANTASAVLYSGTIGAAQEGALAGIPSIGISLDHMGADADFSAVRQLLPPLLKKLLRHYPKKFGLYYNINFPDIPASQIKGVKICHQGIQHWIKEFRPYDKSIFERLGIRPEDMGTLAFPEVEDGEKVYMMVGDLIDDKRNIEPADHRQLAKGYITITAQNTDCTDYEELSRLRDLDFDL